MEPKDFCYWLQGFSELVGTNPTKEQWVIIQDHLNLVFNKVTPTRAGSDKQYCKVSDTWYSNPPQIKCNLEDLNLIEINKVPISC